MCFTFQNRFVTGMYGGIIFLNVKVVIVYKNQGTAAARLLRPSLKL